MKPSANGVSSLGRRTPISSSADGLGSRPDADERINKGGRDMDFYTILDQVVDLLGREVVQVSRDNETDLALPA